MTKGGYVKYSSNNSGGDWWLSDDDWKNLEAAGWEVDWVANWSDEKQEGWSFSKRSLLDRDGRYLGALAESAKRYGVSLRMAIAEWEEITGQRESDEGCHCCGSPHNFYEYDENDRMVW